ncbi:MAG TPA: hypothetical protein PL131_10805 [Methylotenera sp.]|nr:hypothetical protein [Methylotenera sp.]HPH06354.1 hypothetical protein [Methylotenera sp.]HPN00827.1 hypothetical protein [Methylotenera sp.]
MLKNILVLAMLAGPFFLSTISYASENQAAEPRGQVLAKNDSLNVTSISKIAVTDGITKAKKSNDLHSFKRADDITAPTSFFMLLLSLIGFIALSNRRNV